MRCAADMRGAAIKAIMHYMTLSLSKYVNRAAMEFDIGEWPEGSGRKDEHTLHGTVPVKVC